MNASFVTLKNSESWKKNGHYLSLSLVAVFQRTVPNLAIDSKGCKNVYIIQIMSFISFEIT